MGNQYTVTRMSICDGRSSRQDIAEERNNGLEYVSVETY